MLLIDDQLECCTVAPNYIHASDSRIPFTYVEQALHQSSRVDAATLRLPYDASEPAKLIAHELHGMYRNVYVISPKEDCASETRRLLDEHYDGIVIDGKLFLNENDGEICRH